MAILLFDPDRLRHHPFCPINPCLGQMVELLADCHRASLDYRQAMNKFNLSEHLQSSVRFHRPAFRHLIVTAAEAIATAVTIAPVEAAATTVAITKAIALVAAAAKVIVLALLPERQLLLEQRLLVLQHLAGHRLIDHLPWVPISDLYL